MSALLYHFIFAFTLLVAFGKQYTKFFPSKQVQAGK